MNNRVLITGVSGLIGRSLSSALQSKGMVINGLDIRAAGNEYGDIRHLEAVRKAIQGCAGVVHLAAVSRVVWGEREPELCEATNVGGIHNLLDAALEQGSKPWVVFASSREVYGQPDRLPANEETPLYPVNVYAHSKLKGEQLMEAAKKRGLRTSIIRLSNVFGCTRDHPDRVVPAFAKAAAFDEPLRVDGAEHTFDFTHVDDVTRGIVSLIESLQRNAAPLPPIHFVTGCPTTLGSLAKLAIQIANSTSEIRYSAPRSFDVARFCGDPGRASALLGWSPRISLEQGLADLIQAFRDESNANKTQRIPQ